MIRTLLGLGAAAALFGSAQAQSLSPSSDSPTFETVQVAGRDGAAIRSDLHLASVKVCDAARQPYVAGLYDDEATASCVADTYARALSNARRVEPQAFSKAETVAAR